MSKIGFAFVIAAFFIIGCTQAPSKVRSPMISFSFDETNAERPGRVAMTARVYNENDSVAFLRYQADLVLKVDGEELFRERSSSVDIYPFTAANIMVEKYYAKDEFARIAKKLGVNTSEIDQLREEKPVFLGEGQLTLEKIVCTKSKLIDILKGSEKK